MKISFAYLCICITGVVSGSDLTLQARADDSHFQLKGAKLVIGSSVDADTQHASFRSSYSTYKQQNTTRRKTEFAKHALIERDSGVFDHPKLSPRMAGPILPPKKEGQNPGSSPKALPSPRVSRSGSSGSVNPPAPRRTSLNLPSASASTISAPRLTMPRSKSTSALLQYHGSTVQPNFARAQSFLPMIAQPLHQLSGSTRYSSASSMAGQSPKAGSSKSSSNERPPLTRQTSSKSMSSMSRSSSVQSLAQPSISTNVWSSSPRSSLSRSTSSSSSSSPSPLNPFGIGGTVNNNIAIQHIPIPPSPRLPSSLSASLSTSSSELSSARPQQNRISRIFNIGRQRPTIQTAPTAPGMVLNMINQPNQGLVVDLAHNNVPVPPGRHIVNPSGSILGDRPGIPIGRAVSAEERAAMRGSFNNGR